MDLPVYSLHRSRRRTIAIHVQDGKVEVRAPLRAAQRDIEAFVALKTPWIRRKLAELQQRRVEQFPLDDGCSLAVAGQALQVRWLTAVKGEVRREGEVLWICGRALDADRARRLFLRWLCEEAGRLLLPRAEECIARMQLSHRLGGFTLRYTRSLWGRCTGRGNILFNPLILLAPPAVMDYLIVHEASHLQHMDHSPRFWSLVASQCPDWQHSRRWLKEHGHRLRVA